MDDKPRAPPDCTIDPMLAAKLLKEHEAMRHTGELTSAELLEVREVLESRKRWKWIASSIKTWAVSITAVIAAWTVGIDVLRKIVSSLGGK